MKQYKTDLCEGPLFKQILFYSIPLMFSNVLQVLFNMADVAVIGRFSGPVALGAVGSTTTLVMLFTGFLLGNASGISVQVALHAGARDRKELQNTVHTSVILSLIIGFLTMGIGMSQADRMLGLLHTNPELLPKASLYFRIYFSGMPALALYNCGNAILSAIGDTKRPLYYLTISGILNVFLNLFFVLVCHMDVAGVAAASVISQYLSASMILITLFLSREDYALHWSMFPACFTPRKIIVLLKIGIPAGLQYAIFSFANLFIQMGINSFDATMIAGNAAAANADNIVYDVMAAFYTACSSFIGQNFGARKKDRIWKSYFISMGYSFGIGAILGLTLVFFGRPFLSLFTTDPAVIDAGMIRLTIMGFSYAFSAFMDATLAASRGLGKSIIPMFIIIMGSCVFRIAWIYTIFAYFRTITSLYLLFIFSWGITAFFQILYFITIYKKETAF